MKPQDHVPFCLHRCDRSLNNNFQDVHQQHWHSLIAIIFLNDTLEVQNFDNVLSTVYSQLRTTNTVPQKTKT